MGANLTNLSASITFAIFVVICHICKPTFEMVYSVVFERDDGNFAAVGPIYIYRYENGEAGGGSSPGGPMTQKSQIFRSTAVIFSPNPFTKTLSIKLQTQVEVKFSIKAYDVTGRLIKNIFTGKANGKLTFYWNGTDEENQSMPQGVYFLQIRNLDTDETCCKKIIKVN